MCSRVCKSQEMPERITQTWCCLREYCRTLCVEFSATPTHSSLSGLFYSRLLTDGSTNYVFSKMNYWNNLWSVKMKWKKGIAVRYGTHISHKLDQTENQAIRFRWIFYSTHSITAHRSRYNRKSSRYSLPLSSSLKANTNLIKFHTVT